MTHPMEVGECIARIRRRWTILPVQDVDHHVSRYSCAPDFDRPDGPPPVHGAINQHGQKREVIVVREWEAEQLRESLPETMISMSRDDTPIIHYTGQWEYIHFDWARKDLYDTSTISCVHDTTLSQSKLNQTEPCPQPLQDDYPVWYFLTGQIAHPEHMKALWQLRKQPYHRHATVEGLTSIRYKHRETSEQRLEPWESTKNYGSGEALVLSSPNDKLLHRNKAVGLAYLVRDKLSEDRLRYFKTSLFRVKRCKIILSPISRYGQAHEVDGLTFVLDSFNKEDEVRKLAKAYPYKISPEPSIVVRSKFRTKGAPMNSASRHYSHRWPLHNKFRRLNRDSIYKRRAEFYPTYRRRRSSLVPASLQNPSPVAVGLTNSTSGADAKIDETEEDIANTTTELFRCNSGTNVSEDPASTSSGTYANLDETENTKKKKTSIWWDDQPLGITTTTTYTDTASTSQEEENLVEHIEDVATSSDAHVKTEKPTKKKAVAWWGLPAGTTTTETGTEIDVGPRNERLEDDQDAAMTTETVTKTGGTSQDGRSEDVQDAQTTSDADIENTPVSKPDSASDEEGAEEQSKSE
jgi:hypothetical protein